MSGFSDIRVVVSVSEELYTQLVATGASPPSRSEAKSLYPNTFLHSNGFELRFFDVSLMQMIPPITAATKSPENLCAGSKSPDKCEPSSR